MRRLVIPCSLEESDHLVVEERNTGNFSVYMEPGVGEGVMLILEPSHLEDAIRRLQEFLDDVLNNPLP